ncbi:MAG: signal peptidase II [Chthoniobacteraceae bacterium]|nr:signal peptidase II [Chthoniobacteraceae bacterium]
MNLEPRKPGEDEKSAARSLGLLFAGVTLPLYLLDQATKWAVLTHLEVDQAIVTVIPGFFSLVHWRNTGAAFSMLSDSNGFFIGLSTVALVVLAVLGWLGKFRDPLSRVGWAMLLAGILGNLTDRILHGSVVDFLLFNLHVPLAIFPNPWPAFNVADSCIFCAAALFLWQAFREPREDKAEK